MKCGSLRPGAGRQRKRRPGAGVVARRAARRGWIESADAGGDGGGDGGAASSSSRHVGCQKYVCFNVYSFLLYCKICENETCDSKLYLPEWDTIFRMVSKHEAKFWDTIMFQGSCMLHRALRASHSYVYRKKFTAWKFMIPTHARTRSYILHVWNSLLWHTCPADHRHQKPKLWWCHHLQSSGLQSLHFLQLRLGCRLECRLNCRRHLCRWNCHCRGSRGGCHRHLSSRWVRWPCRKCGTSGVHGHLDGVKASHGLHRIRMSCGSKGSCGNSRRLSRLQGLDVCRQKLCGHSTACWTWAREVSEM